ncbi:hypothetical protein [Thalassococcus profundi]|uniref:hypothetical protein n=1 Tax=Thalassococcus profundi TaxID=2282382 RepID=UPI0018F20057|nr:hypothetical protein [Thalassococcus profundi]
MKTLKHLQRAVRNQVPRKTMRDIYNRLRYGAGAPLSDETVWLPLAEITRGYRPDPAKGAPVLRRRLSGMVLGGDWHLSSAPLEPSEKDVSCRMHFIEGRPWEETPIWERHTGEIARGHSPDGCRTIDELRGWYARRDAAFRAIRRAGTLTAAAALPDRVRREHGGILVHIGPNGTYLRSGGGAHRFAIAQLLGLTYIPVQVGVVHRDAVLSGEYAKLHKGLSPPGETRAAAPVSASRSLPA